MANDLGTEKAVARYGNDVEQEFLDVLGLKAGSSARQNVAEQIRGSLEKREDGTWFVGTGMRGYFDLSNTGVSVLPSGMEIDGELAVDDSMTELPKKLTVNGDFDLSRSSVDNMGDDLSVAGNLILRGTKVERLPGRLLVGGYLDTRGTAISEISPQAQISGAVYSDVPLKGMRDSELSTSASGLDVREP